MIKPKHKDRLICTILILFLSSFLYVVIFEDELYDSVVSKTWPIAFLLIIIGVVCCEMRKIPGNIRKKEK